MVERKGVFSALYSDHGSHFWLTPKAGEAVDPHHLTHIERAMRELRVRMIPAYSPQATRGRSERNFGTCQGRLPQQLRLRGTRTVEAANAFLREHYLGEFNRRFQAAAAQPGSALTCRARDLERIFFLQFERTVNRDNTINFQNLTLQIEAVRWRATLAGCTVTVHQHMDGNLSLSYGPHCFGRYDERGCPILNPKLAAGKSVGTDARWKSPKADFPPALRNPS